jgi:hypothetical protein
VRDLLRAEGVTEKIGGLERTVSLDDTISAALNHAAAIAPVAQATAGEKTDPPPP